MKKLGLCIAWHKNNYGGILQSYATLKLVEEYGLDYEIIQYKKKLTPFGAMKQLPRVFNRVMISDKKRMLGRKIGYGLHKEVLPNLNKRRKCYQKFRERYFTKVSKQYHGWSELLEAGKNYDGYLTGSDQLWTPSGLPTNFYNLQFVEDGKPRISYSSSFGVKQIPWYQKGRTKAYLEKMSSIAVRENSAVPIVKELIGKDVPVVADPALLYNAKDWDEFLEDKKIVEGEYILAYLLGTNAQHRAKVQELKEKTGLKVVVLPHIDEYVKADETYGDLKCYDVGPHEFINLIRHAKYVCTDSFHGTVFCAIYHKKMIIFNRNSDKSKTSKNTRIDSLCENLCLSDRRFSNDIYNEMLAEIDFDKVDEQANAMRIRSRKYLEEAFNVV